MRWLGLAALAAGLAGGWAQDTDSGAKLIEARQGEVERLGSSIYGIRLDQGRWAHAAIDACPAFTRHVFARYERQDAHEAFVAIYNRDVPRASDQERPWQGGITLLPLYGIHRGEEPPVAESVGAVEVFNKIWTDERTRAGDLSVFAGISWLGLAECYARVVGEQPVVKTDDDPPALPRFDLRAQKVSGALVPVMGAPGRDRTVYVTFDEQGLVSGAGISRLGPAVAARTGPVPAGKVIPSGPLPVGRPVPQGPEPVGKVVR